MSQKYIANEVTLPDHQIFDPLENVKRITSLGRTAVYAAIKASGFPEPLQLGPRKVVWRRSDVLAWMESRPTGTRITPAGRARLGATA